MFALSIHIANSLLNIANMLIFAKDSVARQDYSIMKALIVAYHGDVTGKISSVAA